MLIAPPPLSKLPWYLRLFFWKQRRKHGQILQPALIWSRQPKLLLAMSIFHQTLNRKKSPLDPQLRALILVHVSQLNQCAFCSDFNAATLLNKNGSTEKLHALADRENSNLFSKAEETALTYAENITLNHVAQYSQHAEQLKQYFSEEAIFELTALIAYQNLSSKFNSALDIPDQQFCKTSSLSDKKTGDN